MGGLTLQLEKHVKEERIVTTPALGMVNMMALWMIKKALGAPVTETMTRLTPFAKWSNVFPRDRMDLVNEMALRKPNGLVSTHNAVAQLSVGEDVEQEIAEIQREAEEAANRQMEVMKEQLAAKAKSSENDSKKTKESNPSQEKKA